ncbi:MAG: alpha/beta fold hydrolase [Kordiimonadaceae bacterium]|nr:alpha/beta fold hydrolase [Kordiimonadaceae bacterium]
MIFRHSQRWAYRFIRAASLFFSSLMAVSAHANADVFSNLPVGTLETRDAIVEMKGVTFRGKIGYITVSEVRSKPDSNKIRVAFMQIYSKSKTPSTPIFRFHGGPDNEAQLAERMPFTFLDDVDFSGSDTSPITVKYDIAYLYHSRYLDFADLVLMDDRGMGLSKPLLHCPRSPEPMDLMKERAESHRLLTGVLEECRTHFEAIGVDFAGYNLPEIAEDIEALRVSLGFNKIALHGGSFGTQTALAYLKKYDANVTAASLVGIEGLDATYDIPSEIQIATEQAIKIANANPDVAAMMPKGDMGYAIKQIYADLEKNPQIYTIQPKGSEPFDVPFTARAARLLLIANGLVLNRGDGPFARSAGTSRIPPLVAAMYHKAYEGIAGIIEKNYEGFRGMVSLNAAANVIDCASGIDSNRLARLYTDTENPDDVMLGALAYVGLQERNPGPLCHVWGIKTLGADFRAPFKTNVPLLILNGNFDGITPMGNAQRLHDTMPNSRLIVVENSGHYGTEMFHFDEKLYQQGADFLRTGQFPSDLKERVTLPPIKYDTLSWGVMLLFKLGLGNAIM